MLQVKALHDEQIKLGDQGLKPPIDSCIILQYTMDELFVASIGAYLITVDYVLHTVVSVCILFLLKKSFSRKPSLLDLGRIVFAACLAAFSFLCCHLTVV